MARFLGNISGGIAGLLDLIDEHEEAIRYDLLVAGLTLDDAGTDRLNWVDLRAFLVNCQPRSAFARSYIPESAGWETTDFLLAALVDSTQVANWQRGGGKGQRPKPIKRPGKSSDKRYGKAPIKISDFDDWWEGSHGD